MLLELFTQIIKEPCFDILRTQEQLGSLHLSHNYTYMFTRILCRRLLKLMCTGYIVFSGIRRASGVQGLRVIVQSDRPPTFVDQRIEAFLVKMGVITCSSHTHT